MKPILVKKKETVRILTDFFVNVHIHGRDMEESYKTTIKQCLYESLKSHIGISCFEPNTKPPITSIRALEIFLEFLEKAKRELGIKRRQYVMFGATDNNLEDCETALRDYREVLGIKIFPLSKTGKNVTTGTAIGVSKKDVLAKIIKLNCKYEKVTERHCDDPEIIAKIGYKIWAELSQNMEAITLTQIFPEAKIMIPHVSNISSLHVIRKAQKEGSKIATGICPHYLMFTSQGHNWSPRYKKHPSIYHCFNNLRTLEHREKLKDYIAIPNPLTIIISDSAGHTGEEKIASEGTSKMIGGLSTHNHMVETVLTVAREKNIPDEQINNLLCFNALNFYNIKEDVKFARYRVRKEIDRRQYNNGIVPNPWWGLELCHLEKIKEK